MAAHTEPPHRAPDKAAEGYGFEFRLDPFERERELSPHGFFRVVMHRHIPCKPDATHRPHVSSDDKLARRSTPGPPRSGSPSTGITRGGRHGIHGSAGTGEGTSCPSVDGRNILGVRASTIVVRAPFPKWTHHCVIMDAKRSISSRSSGINSGMRVHVWRVGKSLYKYSRVVTRAG